MIPVKLTLEGFYSYRTRQTIDFQPLVSANLFGIFGSTGGGKSSILEAIMFALYGKNERLSGKDGLGTNYNMLNLSSNELYVDFEFRIGKNQEHLYRFMVEMRRNKKDFQDVKTRKQQAYKWENEDWTPIEESAEKVIGLSHDHFRLAIIIAQGEFQKFLMMTGGDRQVAMMKLFGLEKYDLSQNVKILETQNTAQYNDLNSRLSEVLYASPEVLAQAETELNASSSTLQNLGVKLNGLRLDLRRMEDRQKLFQTLESRKSEYELLFMQKEAMDVRATRLLEYERCVREIKPLIDRKNDLQQNLQQQKETLQSLDKDIQQNHVSLKSQESVLAGIETTFLKRDDLLKQQAEWEAIKDKKEWENAWLDKEVRLQKGKFEVEKLKNELLEAEKSILEKEKEALAQTPSAEISTQLNQLLEWINERDSKEKEVQKAEKNAEKNREKWDKALSSRETLLKKSPLGSEQYNLPDTQIHQILLAEISQSEKELKQIEETAERWQVRAQIHHLAGELHKGEACPVCGSQEHPTYAQNENAPFQAQESKKAMNEKRQAFHDLQALAKNWEEKSQEWAETRATMLAEQKEAQQLRAEFQTWVQNAPSPTAQNETKESIKNALAEQNQRYVIAESLRKEVQSLRESQKEEQKKLKQYEDRILALSTESATIKGRLDELKKKVEEEKYQLYKELSTAQIDAKIQDLAQQYLKVEELYKSAKNEVQKLKTTADQLGGKREMLRGDMQQNDLLFIEIKQQLLDKAQNLGYEDLHLVQEVLAQPIAIEKEQKVLNEYRTQLAAAHSALREIEAQTEGISFDAQQLPVLRSNLAETETLHEQAQQAMGQAQAQFQRVEAHYKQKQTWQAELEKLQFRAEHLDTLKKLFTGKKFVEFISAIYLERLCHFANERFVKMTRGQLRLELGAENHFMVRDYLNGGEIRGIKTLSGGQMFQAALSLAVALSDSVQQQTQSSQNFFFIDEGFGTQDKESLQMIFDTLRSLRKENRVVGIISHVEELQQEIPACIRVRNEEGQGSIAELMLA